MNREQTIERIREYNSASYINKDYMYGIIHMALWLDAITLEEKRMLEEEVAQVKNNR